MLFQCEKNENKQKWGLDLPMIWKHVEELKMAEIGSVLFNAAATAQELSGVD